MTVFTITEEFTSYANNGQRKEQNLRFALTGKIEKADNIPFDVKADCLDIQIKSARATICKGTDIETALLHDKATRYAYITKDYTVYLMDKSEYIAFAKANGTVTNDSAKNGGGVKTRFKHESVALLKWLSTYCWQPPHKGV